MARPPERLGEKASPAARGAIVRSESAEAGYDGLDRQIYASRNGDEIHYVYNGFGELTGEVSLSGTKKYTYDETGLLTKKEISSKLGIEAATELEYDKMNRPVSVKTAVGTETVSYDKAGRITKKHSARPASA